MKTATNTTTNCTFFLTAFGDRHQASVATIKTSAPGCVWREDAGTEVREFFFGAFNRPEEGRSLSERSVVERAERDGRCYTPSVGDLIELEDSEEHHSLAIVANFGYKVLAEGDDCERVRKALINSWRTADCPYDGRGWFDQFARKHEEAAHLVGR